ncbi:MAG: BatA domain-containing protein [Chitinophagaceae bacterium]
MIQPIWLFALAGIAIPVIIHLWNIKKGRTVKVGSISLLTQRSKQNARNLRLTDLLLLLLRCLFISLLVIILSKPQWHQRSPTESTKGWILAEPGSLVEMYSIFKPLVDSLLQKGFEFHSFSPGFREEELQSVLKKPNDTLAAAPLSYWSLLKELDEKVPGNLPIHLFTNNSLNRFSGNRPTLSLNLEWHAYTAADSVSSTLAAAYLTPENSIRVLKAESNSTGTLYSSRTIAYTDQRDIEYSILIEMGKLLVSNSVDRMEADTSTMRITIYTDNFNNDALYLKASLQAIQQYTARKIIVSQEKNSKDITAKQDWLFWLSESPVPARLQSNTLFRYENGTPVRKFSHIITHKTSLNSDPVSLYKLIPPGTSEDISTDTWKDDFDDPVLVKQMYDSNTVYHFYSRFDPEWNDLVWSEEFPRMLGNLVMDGNYGKDHVADKRIIDSLQLQPAILPSFFNKGMFDSVALKGIQRGWLGKDTYKKAKNIKNTDLSNVIWLTAFIVFFLERVLSFNNKKQIV